MLIIMYMPEKNKKEKLSKRYFTFFGGIAYCLFAVALILNVGYPARFFAFPFAYLFGLGSYLIYIFIYAYGLFLFFKEKGFKIRFNNYLFGPLIIFISALMIATLIVAKDSGLTMNNFVEQYNSVIKNIDGIGSFNAYWKASFINLFQRNKFGGGFIGYALVGVLSPLKIGGTWAVSILVLLLGLFVLFFPIIKKIISGEKVKKEKKAKAERPVSERDIGIINQDDVIASARTLDTINDVPTPIVRQNKPQAINKPADFKERNEVFNTPLEIIAYSAGSNFTPAVFAKYQNKPSVDRVAPEQRITGEQALLEANRQSKINEQMVLDFNQKPEINEKLVAAQPEFIEPTPVRASVPIQPEIVKPAPVTPVAEKKPIKWVPPSTALLENLEIQGAIEENERVAEERMAMINEVFDDFRVGARCVSYVIGPAVTRYNIEYGSNVSVRSVEKLVEDISVRLRGVIARFETIVTGQKYSGLEIPNAKITAVSYKEVFEQLPDPKKHPLAVMFGKNIDGKCVGADFDEFPHILVAGTTGSGKSIFNHSLVCTLISRNSPEDLRLVLIDPKQVELAKYEDLPHLLCPIINDANVAKLTLSKLCDEMNRRYGVLKSTGCSNLTQYNEIREENPSLEKLPYIVVFIDEYADLVDNCKDISQPIVSLAQKARAAGIHMLIATQRPSTNIITGTIKSNLPTSVALRVRSFVDSTTILGEGGAEKLLGRGDMLVFTPLVDSIPVRMQGCYIQNKEILRIVGYLKEHYPVNYDPNFCNLEDAASQAAGDFIGSPEFQNSQEAGEENKYQSIKEWVMASEYMSMSRIQRECGVGFNRAGRFFKRLQDEGVVGTETEGNKGCPVLVHDKFYEGSADTDIPVSVDQSE